MPPEAGLAVEITGASVTAMGQGDKVNISEVTCELQPALGTSGAEATARTKASLWERICMNREQKGR